MKQDNSRPGVNHHRSGELLWVFADSKCHLDRRNDHAQTRYGKNNKF